MGNNIVDNLIKQTTTPFTGFVEWLLKIGIESEPNAKQLMQLSERTNNEKS